MKSHILGVLLLLATSCKEVPSAEVAFERGNSSLDAGDFERAIEFYTTAVEQNPTFALAYNNRGLARSAQKNFNHAVQDYDACLALPKPFPEAYYNRGVALFRLGRNASAIADFTEALKLSPGYVRAHAGRALALAAGGDHAAALADYRKALELAPPDWADRKSIEAEIARLSDSGK